MAKEDIPKVASLYEFVMRSGSRVPAPRLERYFERTFFDHPWVDPEIPSLVYETPNGDIAAFLGSHVRSLRFQEDRIRVGCSGQLVGDPHQRIKGAGALLLRRYLQGPQELSATDGATPEVRQMWEQLGGSTAFLTSLSWLRLFRPFRAAGNKLVPDWAPRLRPLWSALDGLGAGTAGTLLRPPPPATQTEHLTPKLLMDHLPLVTRHLQVRPDYNEASLSWLFTEMERLETRGQLTRRLVRDLKGRVLGWYVAYMKPGSVGNVLQIAATPRDTAAVVDRLFHDAWHSGCAALKGRLEPLLFPAMHHRRCLIRHDAITLIHSPNTALLSAIYSGKGLLTRLEGEWWMGHHVEPFT